MPSMCDVVTQLIYNFAKRYKATQQMFEFCVTSFIICIILALLIILVAYTYAINWVYIVLHSFILASR